MAIEDQPVEGTYSLTFMGPRRGNTVNSDSPAFVSADCEWMESRSRVCRDLRAGTANMVAKAETYLPRYPNEDTEDYGMRLQFASLRNYYGQCIQSILGKVFTQPPALNDDVPEPVAEHLKDADLNGNHWTIVAEEFFDAAVDEGLSWLIVDYHSTKDIQGGKELTLRDEQEMGVRPYWVVVHQHRVLGLRYKQERGKFTITQFRFVTRITVEDGDYGEKEIDEISVYRPLTIEKYRQDANGEWVLHGEIIVNTLGMVPVVPLNLNKRGPFKATPPLENLAYMNLEHFQVRSDQRRALAVASFPILATFGVDSKSGKARIGPMTSFAFEEEHAKMLWIESNGVHLAAGDRELVSLETHMRTFGLSFENPGMYATATGRNIDASDAVAPIIRWAFRMRDALNIALWYHAKWMKLKDGGTIDVNTTFLRNMITVEGLKLLVEALKEGAITAKGFLDRMKDYGILAEDFDTDAEAKELEAKIKAAKDEKAKLAVIEAAARGSANPRNLPDHPENKPEA